MIGIVSYGAYIPFYRLERKEIGRAWGKRGGPGEKAVHAHVCSDGILPVCRRLCPRVAHADMLAMLEVIRANLAQSRHLPGRRLTSCAESAHTSCRARSASRLRALP